jgi:hypothetical protein
VRVVVTSQLCFHFSNFEQNRIKGLCVAVILRFAAHGCKTPFVIALTGNSGGVVECRAEEYFKPKVEFYEYPLASTMRY